MLLHIGDDVGIPLEKLICVLNGKTLSPESRAVIDRVKKERVSYFSCGRKPKSYVLVRGSGTHLQVYESVIASTTLQRRWRSACLHEQIEELAVLSVTAAGD